MKRLFNLVLSILLIFTMFITVNQFKEVEAFDMLDFEAVNGLTYYEIFGNTLYGRTTVGVNDCVITSDSTTNNLIEEGSFCNIPSALVAWDDLYGALSIIDEYAVITGDGSQSLFILLQEYNLFPIVDDIIYIYSDSYLEDTIDLNRLQVRSQDNQSPYTTFFHWSDYDKGLWKSNSSLFAVVDIVPDRLLFEFRENSGLGGTLNHFGYIDNVIVLNLTNIFGINNEPTLEEMDSALIYYKTHIDSYDLSFSRDLSNPITYLMAVSESLFNLSGESEESFIGRINNWFFTPTEINMFSVEISYTPAYFYTSVVLFQFLALLIIKRYVPLA